MMNVMTRRGHRGAAAAILFVGGGAVAAATWASGNRKWSIVVLVLYVAFSAIAYAWAGHPTDVGQLLRGGGDERQRALDRDATAITGAVLSVVAVVWAIISLARTGNPGVPGTFCVIAGITYGVALAVLRRRR